MPKKKDPVAQANGDVQHAAPDAQQPAAPAPEANGNGEKRPPATTVRLGRVKVAVWVNYTREGRPFYAAVPTRVYRTADGEYANATSFDRGDLLVLAEALRQAFLWIAQNPLTNGDDDVPF